MVKLQATYTVYQYSPVKNLDEKRFGLDVRLPTSDSSVFGKDLDELVANFVSQGWEIDDRDTLKTISPIVLNEWDSKPWNNPFEPNEFDLMRGRLMQYEELKKEDLDEFYHKYIVLKNK